MIRFIDGACFHLWNWNFIEFMQGRPAFFAGYIQDGRTPVKRNSIASALMGIIFLAIGAGVYPWRAWGRKLCLVVSSMLGWGSIGYLAFAGLDGKPMVALAVVISVLVWLHLPVVRYRLRMGSSQ